MAWIVGVDEAGYGPNLGPLCVAVSAWAVGEAENRELEAGGETGAPNSSSATSALRPATSRLQSLSRNLYDVLATAVTRVPDGERIAIADSKRLYKPGGGLGHLERGVHGALMSRGCSAASYGELVHRLAADPNNRRGALPWHDGFDAALPADTQAEELVEPAAKLAHASDAGRLAPPRLFARLVFPAEFNELVERYGVKSSALSHVTLGMLREALDALDDDAPASVCCTLDKHGGRNRYGPLLQHHFPEHWVETLSESRAVSEYEWGPADARVTFAFRAGGESCLATALASMTAKYLRELSMRALNEFWTQQTPGLQPTAGYPVDAKRFKAQIAATQRELGIDDRLLWRNR